ncbi:hypothetical protein EGW08_012388 [Elysia chlorotica]|uniref:Metalloendopeptidase n=1 Tax=Elysia chlorotica TaxID=188477 RepID=A0A3S1BAZ4_ELYCH|nr:hypothetical protein EGW08_012388 [Elysia chlorotica]
MILKSHIHSNNFLFVVTVVVCASRSAAAPAALDDGSLVEDINYRTDRNAVADNIFKWPNGIVPYVINNNFDVAVKKKIVSAMQSIENSVNSAQSPCVHFVPRNGHYNYLDIYQGSRCHSSVGMENRGRQEVSIGSGCEFKGIIMHELLHALGFYHEHSRYDRDENVKINFENVASGGNLNFELKTPNEMSLQNTPYDFNSIMSYDAYTMAADGSRPVMVPLPGKADQVFQMGQRLWLSDLDVHRIQSLYGCQKDTTHVDRPEQDNNVLACNFQSDLCGMTAGSADFNWVRTTGSSPAGPGAGHSTGTDTYLVALSYGNNGKTASIVTPMSSAGGPCIDFFLFLRDSSSSLDILASGPDFMATKIPFTPSSWAYGQWTRYQRKINLPPGFPYQITFRADIGSADVALDDIRMYTGACN